MRDALGVPLPDRYSDRVRRTRRRPARRPRRPLRPHPRPVLDRPGRESVRAGPRRGRVGAAPARARKAGGRGRIPARDRRHRVVRRGCPAAPAAPVARRGAGGGRTGRARRARPVPAALAARRWRPARHRRRRGGDRTACGRADSGLGLGTADPRVAGERLLPGDARRTHRDRRGAVVRARVYHRQGRLDARCTWPSRHRSPCPPRPRSNSPTCTCRSWRCSAAVVRTSSGNSPTRSAPNSALMQFRGSPRSTTRNSRRRCGIWCGQGTSAATRSHRCAR